MKRETRERLAIVAAFVVLIGVMVGYNAYATDRERPTALVVDVTARQRTLTERYIKDTVLVLDGVQADPEASAKILRETATRCSTAARSSRRRAVWTNGSASRPRPTAQYARSSNTSGR